MNRTKRHIPRATSRPASSRPPTTTGTRPSIGRRLGLLLGAAAVVAGLTAFVLLGGGTGDEAADYSCGSPRIVGVDLASQNRSDAQVGLAVDVLAGHFFGAAVCRESLTVVGVAAGTPALVTLDEAAIPELTGPNPRARAQVARNHLDDIHDAAAAALDETYSAHPEVATTSMPALYDAVAAHAEAGARIVLVTTGVHDTTEVTLNRALAEGEGSAAAQAMTWPTLPVDVTVTAIGIGQMDGTVPAPGELWPREVMAFNRDACAATGAARCDLHQVADVDKAQL